MSIKTHHGPPGSYKTAGAMSEDFVRAAKEGRVIVTNVRGVTAERVRQHVPGLPSDFDVIHVGDKTPEDRRRWAIWFHWVPPGAFIFVDEAQKIWPKNWRESDIRSLDYPGGLNKAAEDDRPPTWEAAFEQHRHWNWDMVFTTPNYNKIRQDIKDCGELAYKHKNLGIFGNIPGLKGRYIEGAHLADDDGGSVSQFLTINKKKVPSYVFNIYDSTATGEFSDTKAGFNLLGNPRVALLLFVLLTAGYFFFRGDGLAVIQDPVGHGRKTASSAPSASGKAAPSTGAVPAHSVQRGTPNSDPRLEPLADESAYLVASYRKGWRWHYAIAFRGQTLTDNDLLDMGYELQPAGSCGLVIRRAVFERFLSCAFIDQARPSGAERSAGALGPSSLLGGPAG